MKQRNVTERSVPVNVSEEVQTDIKYTPFLTQPHS